MARLSGLAAYRAQQRARAVGAGLVGKPPLAAWRQITGRVGLPGTYTGGSTAGFTWVDHYPIYQAGRYLRFQFVNRMLSEATAEEVPANPYVAKADLRLNGTRYALTFGGNASITLAPGEKAWTDILDVTYAPGDLLRLVSYLTNSGTDAATRKHAANPQYGVFAYQEAWKANDLTGSGWAEPSSAAPSHAPCCAIIGMPSAVRPSVIIIGSSSGFGRGDEQAAPDYAQGYASRALSLAGIPHVRASVSSDTIQKFLATNLYRLEAAADSGVTHCIMQLASNDITNGASLAELKDRYMLACDKIAAIVPRIIGVTATVVTDSTDNWATLANQAPRPSAPIRLAFNEWLKTKPHRAHVMVTDPCARLMDAGDPEKWKVDGTANKYTVDGTHCSPFAHDLEGQAEALELAALTVT